MYRLDAVAIINGERAPIFDWGEDEGEDEATRAALSEGYAVPPAGKNG